GLATYDKGDEFEHTAAEGFVKLWGLPLKIWARRARGGRKDPLSSHA
ncbi:MAG: argininosuccinate synthase, partial [Acidimicrobiia bacterium]